MDNGIPARAVPAGKKIHHDRVRESGTFSGRELLHRIGRVSYAVAGRNCSGIIRVRADPEPEWHLGYHQAWY